MHRSMGDVDGPRVAKSVYEAFLKEKALEPDTIAYALDDAVRQLRSSGIPLYRWAPYIHMGA
jgi:hypothetical protein